MKVAIIIYSLRYGGAEKQAVTDANSLAKGGFEITFFYHHFGDLYYFLDQKIRKIQIKGVFQISSSTHLFFHLLKNQFDVIHAHMFWAEKISTIPALITRQKLLFNEHGLGLWRKWHHRFIMKTISNYCIKIICSCELNKKIRQEKEKIKNEKLCVVYNSFSLSKPILKSSSKEKYNSFIIGFVGRFDKVKRIQSFIEIAKQLIPRINTLKFILVGDGPEMHNMKQIIMKENLNDYFYLPGYKQDTETYYSSFDVFVLPSRIEAFSVSLLEAGFYGIPSIVYDIGGNSEIIEDGQTGYIVPDNRIDIITEKIFFLFKHPFRKTKLGEKAKQKVISKFSIDQRINKLIQIYEEII